MMYPKVCFIYNDIQAIAGYICFLAKSISKGYYAKENFLVLPYSDRQNTKVVYFPDLDLSKKFWKGIVDCKNKNFADDYPKSCLDEVISKLPKTKKN